LVQDDEATLRPAAGEVKAKEGVEEVQTKRELQAAQGLKAKLAEDETAATEPSETSSQPPAMPT
jgi:hypothetical protein